jgi:hypothetical protein
MDILCTLAGEREGPAWFNFSMGRVGIRDLIGIEAAVTRDPCHGADRRRSGQRPMQRPFQEPFYGWRMIQSQLAF